MTYHGQTPHAQTDFLHLDNWCLQILRQQLKLLEIGLMNLAKCTQHTANGFGQHAM